MSSFRLAFKSSLDDALAAAAEGSSLPAGAGQREPLKVEYNPVVAASAASNHYLRAMSSMGRYSSQTNAQPKQSILKMPAFSVGGMEGLLSPNASTNLMVSSPNCVTSMPRTREIFGAMRPAAQTSNGQRAYDFLQGAALNLNTGENQTARAYRYPPPYPISNVSYPNMVAYAPRSLTMVGNMRQSTGTNIATQKTPGHPNGAMVPKREFKPATLAKPNLCSPTPTTSVSFPKNNVKAGYKPPSIQPSFANKTTFSPSKVLQPQVYVGIVLERPETVTSWGLVFTKDKRNHALIIRVIQPSTVGGPTVKWCQITSSAPRNSVVYRTRTTGVMPLVEYEPFLTQNFPPLTSCEETRLRDSGLLKPYVAPGDAIISVNGIPVSAFESIGQFASFIRLNCQRKMMLVAKRHGHVWKAAMKQTLAPRPDCPSHQQKEGGGKGGDQKLTDGVSKAVRDAWREVMYSGNHSVKRKLTAPSPTVKKQPKIYTNSMFRDKSGKPLPYCDNQDFDPDEGRRIHGFVNKEIEKSFDQWLKKRKATWAENRPRKYINHITEAAIVEEPEEELTVQQDFWTANGYESFDHWLSASKSKWTRSYSWHKERREALQLECEKEVHFPISIDTTTASESQALLNQFENWLSARKQQWRLERRKRQRYRVEASGSIEDEKTCLAEGASSGDYMTNDPIHCTANPSNQAMYFDEILEDEEERLTKEEEPHQPMDISWLFDSQHGAPDDIIVNIMTYLLPADHGNLLCISYTTNYLFKQREDMWKTLCPKHWILPRRPRKAWSTMYITKIRAEEEATRKKSDDLLVKAGIIIEKGDQLNKLEKLIRKTKEFDVNYVSGVVQERNSLLNLAVIEKRHKIIKWLIEDKGADTETCDRGQFTPLMNAAWNGDKYIVRYLLGKGCDRTKLGYNHLSQGLAPATFKGLNAEGWARKRGHDDVAELIKIGV